MLTLNQIRSTFLDYFRRNNHTIVSSSSLIPHNDPSMMFTNSGMVQFKNCFLGEEKRNYTKATSAQKCVRAGGKHNDLDNVGYTARHHTFFEMLGNFSFGDYFKEQAIFFAWECLTKDLALPKEKLYITVYHTDDEAIKWWKKIANLNDDRIIKIDTNDNFWSMGDTGPCGPCTEIFYDHGDKIYGGLPGTKDADGDRYIEIWNLVFMQYEQFADGKRANLPKPSIDTGMGLERIATVLQNLHNNYEIDLFQNLINYTENITKVKAKGEALTSYRVIADHLRSTSFLIADGVMPSNEGRGYVLRRIMRRGMRHIHHLGYQEPLMHQLVAALINEMGEAYPELIRARKFIEDVLLQEELKFKRTLGKGIKLLEDEINKIRNNNELSGDVAFKLYDTYGFPLDLTIDILRNKNIGIDEKGFNKAMAEQKARARAAWAGSGETATAEIWFDIYEKHGATEFLGYEQNSVEAKVLDIIDFKDDLKLIITNQTPFYGESGGQIGDIGIIKDQSSKEYEVVGTMKFLGKIHAHICKKPEFQKGNNVNLIVNIDHRTKLRANHSATHLLHYVLRKNLGEHITQKGSLVSEDKLRFDFSHTKALTTEEIGVMEQEINQLIRNNTSAATKLMEIDKAIESGAMALFGEKYDEEVRVVTMGNSVELCGGTHVKATGDIGLFKITSEAAIAAGIRRIEAVTGEIAIKYIQQQQAIINDVATQLKISASEIKLRVISLINDKKKFEKEISDLKLQSLKGEKKSAALNNYEQIAGFNFMPKIFNDVSPKELRTLVDSLRTANNNNVVVATSNFEDKASIIIGLHPANTSLNAAELVKQAIAAAGGSGGGGRNDIAQAGGFDFKNSQVAIDRVKEVIAQAGLSG